MNRRSPLRRTAIVLAALIVGGAVGLAIDIGRVGGLDAWLSARGPTVIPTFDVPPYEARGRLVEVDGRSVYLDCRGAGSPTVILETGFGGGADGWGYVLDGVAAFTRVCAWDRPGIGRSAARGLHSAGEAAADLRAALETAGEEGPFIVVAHSLGGVYARVFAAAGPPGGRGATARDAVLAFVMLDTYEPDLGVADDPALSPETRAMVRQALDDGGTMLQAGEEVDWAATLAELRPLNPTELPAVLLMTDPHQHYGGHEPAVTEALVAAWYRAIPVRYPNGTLEIVPTGHFVQLERPDLVIERVRELVTEQRAG
ncbi:MAG: alpha/beta hydrolase [Chloroflexi bacterium]|nr:MAG: alpha/beta hydrolase [Chloroflexota bacterium]